MNPAAPWLLVSSWLLLLAAVTGGAAVEGNWLMVALLGVVLLLWLVARDRFSGQPRQWHNAGAGNCGNGNSSGHCHGDGEGGGSGE